MFWLMIEDAKKDGMGKQAFMNVGMLNSQSSMPTSSDHETYQPPHLISFINLSIIHAM